MKNCVDIYNVAILLSVSHLLSTNTKNEKSEKVSVGVTVVTYLLCVM